MPILFLLLSIFSIIIPIFPKEYRLSLVQAGTREDGVPYFTVETPENFSDVVYLSMDEYVMLLSEGLSSAELNNHLENNTEIDARPEVARYYHDPLVLKQQMRSFMDDAYTTLGDTSWVRYQKQNQLIVHPVYLLSEHSLKAVYYLDLAIVPKEQTKTELEKLSKEKRSEIRSAMVNLIEKMDADKDFRKEVSKYRQFGEFHTTKKNKNIFNRGFFPKKIKVPAIKNFANHVIATIDNIEGRDGIFLIFKTLAWVGCKIDFWKHLAKQIDASPSIPDKKVINSKNFCAVAKKYFVYIKEKGSTKNLDKKENQEFANHLIDEYFIREDIDYTEKEVDSFYHAVTSNPEIFGDFSSAAEEHSHAISVSAKLSLSLAREMCDEGKTEPAGLLRNLASNLLDLGKKTVCALRLIGKGGAEGLLYVGERAIEGIRLGAGDISCLISNPIEYFSNVANDGFFDDKLKEIDYSARELFTSISNFIEYAKREPLSVVGDAVSFSTRALTNVAFWSASYFSLIKPLATCAATVASTIAVAAKEVLSPNVFPVISGGVAALQTSPALSGLSAAANSIVGAVSQSVSQVAQGGQQLAESACASLMAGDGGGTVWDDISPTQECYDGTSIPKSFELQVRKDKFWVHGNATEHMKDHLVKKGSSLLEAQTLLTDFRNTIASIVEEGIRYEKIYVVGKWEIIFSPPRTTGLLPVVKHAMFLGW